jgi:hypothetical protein
VIEARRRGCHRARRGAPGLGAAPSVKRAC